MPNIINEWIQPGLKSWEKHGASVSMLKLDGVSVPQIIAPAYSTENHLGIVIAGQHTEETSGPRFALRPKNFEQHRRHGFSFLLFPAANQYGLRYDEKGPEHPLRYDQQDRLFNNGFGNTSENQPTEEKLIQEAITDIGHHRRLSFAIGLHEDSDNPGVGYIYTHRVDVHRRDKIRSTAKRLSLPLAKLTKDSPQNIIFGGEVEDGFVIADPQDGFSFEEWTSETFGISAAVIEGPFNLPLKKRIQFQATIFNILLNNLA